MLRHKRIIAAALLLIAGLTLAACDVDTEGSVEEGGDLTEPDVQADVTADVDAQATLETPETVGEVADTEAETEGEAADADAAAEGDVEADADQDSTGPDEAPPVSGQATVNLIAELRNQGATVSEEGVLQDIDLGLKGIQLSVNGHAVEVFEFASADEASAEAQAIASGELTDAIEEMLGGETHVYQQGELVAVYSGSNEDVMTRLSETLGAEVQAE